MDCEGQFRIPKSIAVADFVQLIALEEYTMKIIEEKNAVINPCALKEYCEKFVRNLTPYVGCAIRKLETTTLDELEEKDINTFGKSVISEDCEYPMKRDVYNNLCPFTYVRRNIEQNNQK